MDCTFAVGFPYFSTGGWNCAKSSNCDSAKTINPSISRLCIGPENISLASRAAVAEIKFAIFRQSCFPIDGYFSLYEPGKCDHLMGDEKEILRKNISNFACFIKN